jgi:hypothetical protein
MTVESNVGFRIANRYRFGLQGSLIKGETVLQDLAATRTAKKGGNAQCNDDVQISEGETGT